MNPGGAALVLARRIEGVAHVDARGAAAGWRLIAAVGEEPPAARVAWRELARRLEDEARGPAEVRLALACLREGADRGDGPCLHRLGQAHQRGHAVPIDPRAAAVAFGRALEAIRGLSTDQAASHFLTAAQLIDLEVDVLADMAALVHAAEALGESDLERDLARALERARTRVEGAGQVTQAARLGLALARVRLAEGRSEAARDLLLAVHGRRQVDWETRVEAVTLRARALGDRAAVGLLVTWGAADGEEVPLARLELARLELDGVVIPQDVERATRTLLELAAAGPRGGQVRARVAGPRVARARAGHDRGLRPPRRARGPARAAAQRSVARRERARVARLELDAAEDPHGPDAHCGARPGGPHCRT